MTLNFMGYLKLEEDPARIASQTQGPLRETLLRPNKYRVIGTKQCPLIRDQFLHISLISDQLITNL